MPAAPPASSRCRALDKGKDSLRVEGSGHQIALPGVGSEPVELPELRRRFDSFGNDLHAERVAEGDDGANKRRALIRMILHGVDK
jgi:hypothetical protein